MEERKRNKIKSRLVWGGFFALVFFVIITSIVLNFQQKKREELIKENERIEQVDDQSIERYQPDFEMMV